MYTQSDLDSGQIARPISPLTALEFLSIERLFIVILPCHGKNIPHSLHLSPSRFGYIHRYH